jgi:hypothetical protein
MIKIWLFRYGRVCAEDQAETEKGADRAIDCLITDVLAGRHGNGEFHLDAERVNDIGGFVARHFTCEFVRPAPKVKKPV